MTPLDELQRLEVWKTRWRCFLGMYPEVCEIPLKLDREWLVSKMAAKCMFHEKDTPPLTEDGELNRALLALQDHYALKIQNDARNDQLVLRVMEAYGKVKVEGRTP